MDIESIFITSNIVSDYSQNSDTFGISQSFDAIAFPTNNNPVIGVIDTGFDTELLKQHESSIQFGADWVDGDNDPLTGNDNIHGTAIALEMGDASLWLGRAVDAEQGGNWAASLVEFTNTAISQGKHGVANLSFEVLSEELSQDEWKALEYASDRGILIVTAAGNNPGNIGALGRASLQFDNFLTVGALTETGAIALNSGSGVGLDLMANGSNGQFFGSSLAAAKVSEAAEQLWALNPNLSASVIASILKESATDLNLAGWDAQSGYGALNLDNALAVASNSHQVDSGVNQPLLSLTELGVLDAHSFTNPLFQVVGSKIYDSNGVEFIAKGVNINGPGYGWPGDTVAYADEVVNQWGFNAIRLNVKELEPSTYTYEENGTIAEIVDAYTSRGAVVIIEAHENTGDYFVGEELDNLVAWWRQQAQQFKDNPNVWFNISNEPGGSNSSDSNNVSKWLDQNQKAISAIREEGANNIIVVDAHYWGQDAGEWNSTSVDQEKSALLNYSQQLSDPNQNLVFSVHLYDQWAYGDDKMADYFDRLQDTEIPFIIGEYGTPKDGSLQSTVTSMYNTAVSREIGRFAWAWWGGDDYELTTSGNGGGQYAEYDSKGNLTNLSWFGQQVIADNRRVEDLDVLTPSIPSVSINNVTITEGDSGTSIARFTVALSSASNQAITVNYATADGSAIAGSDYLSNNGTLTFNAGQTTQTIDIQIVGDTVVEADETLFLNLSNAVNATIADSQGQATIVNNDITLPTLSINDIVVTEGDRGKNQIQFTVTLSSASNQTITVNYTTVDGTATDKNDYFGTSGTLTFNPGETTQTITIGIKGDRTVESDESFFVNLSNPSNATFSKGQGKGTIVDNDGASSSVPSKSQTATMSSNSVETNITKSNMNASIPNHQSLSVGYSAGDRDSTNKPVKESNWMNSEDNLVFSADFTHQEMGLFSFLPLWKTDESVFPAIFK